MNKTHSSLAGFPYAVGATQASSKRASMTLIATHKHETAINEQNSLIDGCFILMHRDQPGLVALYSTFKFDLNINPQFGHLFMP